MKSKAVLLNLDAPVLETCVDLAAAGNPPWRDFSMPERSIDEFAAARGNGAA